MKRSSVLYVILLAMVIAVAIAGFTFPQKALDYYEPFFLLFVLPLMGWMWIQAFVDASRGK